MSWSMGAVSGECSCCLSGHALGWTISITPVFHPRQQGYFTQRGRLIHPSPLVTLGNNLGLLSSEFFRHFVTCVNITASCLFCVQENSLCLRLSLLGFSHGHSPLRAQRSDSDYKPQHSNSSLVLTLCSPAPE